MSDHIKLNIDKIPRNPNTINEGWTDPQPEKGKKGSFWRRLISGLKGFGTGK